MTGATNFTIDSTLTPADADASLGDLKSWLASASSGLLDISPLPLSPQLPTQTALQLLLVAAAELVRRGDHESRMTPGAQALCAGLLGSGSLTDLAQPLALETANG